MCCGNVPSVSQSVFVETYEEGWEEAHLVWGVCSTAGSEGRLKMDASGLENTHTHTHEGRAPGSPRMRASDLSGEREVRG